MWCNQGAFATRFEFLSGKDGGASFRLACNDDEGYLSADNEYYDPTDFEVPVFQCSIACI